MNEAAKKIHRLSQDGIISILTSFLFCCYNTYIGFSKGNVFSLSIAAYYLLLCLMRLFCFILMKKSLKSGKENVREYKVLSSFLFILNLLLVGPVILLAMHQKEYKGEMIQAIAMAAYSTYKITMAIIGFVKGRKTDSMGTSIRMTLSMTDALVSILSLQNTLLIVNGGADKEDMRILSIVSSCLIFLVILLLTIFDCVRIWKYDKKRKSQDESGLTELS